MNDIKIKQVNKFGVQQMDLSGQISRNEPFGSLEPWHSFFHNTSCERSECHNSPISFNTHRKYGCIIQCIRILLVLYTFKGTHSVYILSMIKTTNNRDNMHLYTLYITFRLSDYLASCQVAGSFEASAADKVFGSSAPLQPKTTRTS